MSKYQDYFRELKELEDLAEQERMFDVFDDEDCLYADGFLAGYHQAMRNAKQVFSETF